MAPGELVGLIMIAKPGMKFWKSKLPGVVSMNGGVASGDGPRVHGKYSPKPVGGVYVQNVLVKRYCNVSGVVEKSPVAHGPQKLCGVAPPVGGVFVTGV